MREQRLEDYVVAGLMDRNDVSYDDHAELLYELAGQMVRHLLSYLSEEDARKVLQVHQREIAGLVYAQMQRHCEDGVGGHEVTVRRGFIEFKPSAYTAPVSNTVRDFQDAPADRSNMMKYLFGGFRCCLYPLVKFGSDAERMLAVILEREEVRWFKPQRGQFQIWYRMGGDQLEYQPDFVAEAADCIYMLEPKALREMESAEVQAKRAAAVEWCRNATTLAPETGGKPWKYVLIPHGAIQENMSLAGLAARFG